MSIQTMAAIGLFGVAILGNVPAALSWLSARLASRTNPAEGGNSSDTADFSALTLLQHRYERLNCPEGKAAIQVLLTHFFHDQAPDA